jgi:hypothetical protein
LRIGQSYSDYARELFAKGRSKAQVIAALVNEGKKPRNAEAIVWAAQNNPQPTRANAGAGYGGSVCVSTALSKETDEALRAVAAKRGVTRSRLASLIIEAVVEDNLFNAVLEDEGAQ